MTGQVTVIRGAQDGAPLQLGGKRITAALSVPIVIPSSPAASMMHAVRESAVPPDLAKAHAFEEGRETGHSVGYAQGLKDGFESGLNDETDRTLGAAREALQTQTQLNEQAADLLKRLRRIVESVNEQRDRLLHEAQEDMVALAFEALCRFLGDEHQTLPLLKSQVSVAIQAWQGRADLAIHVHPDDRDELMRDSILAAQLRSRAQANVQWVADPEVVLGGCLLKSSEGALDARLETILGSLKNALNAVRSVQREA